MGNDSVGPGEAGTGVLPAGIFVTAPPPSRREQTWLQKQTQNRFAPKDRKGLLGSPQFVPIRLVSRGRKGSSVFINPPLTPYLSDLAPQGSRRKERAACAQKQNAAWDGRGHARPLIPGGPFRKWASVVLTFMDTSPWQRNDFLFRSVISIC